MTTVADVLNEAFRKSGLLGIGQTMDGGDTVSALADFNDMVAQWQTQRWMNFGLQDVFFTSTGVNTYTVGPTGQFNIPFTPTRLEAAYQRQLVPSGLNVDTPLEIIPSMEEYSRLSLKGLISFGLYAFLDTSSYPLATLRLYPIPNATIYQIHIIVKTALPTYTQAQLGTTISLPMHYTAAFKWNLAQILRAGYGKQPSPLVDKMAMRTLSIVKQSNLQIPELVMPKGLTLPTNGYNILSDQFGNA